jgi:hypothetical protein
MIRDPLRRFHEEKKAVPFLGTAFFLWTSRIIRLFVLVPHFLFEFPVLMLSDLLPSFLHNTAHERIPPNQSKKGNILCQIKKVNP